MSVVVDASVAAKWLVPENDSDKAEKLLLRWQRKTIELTAPRMILAEIANTLAKKVMRGFLPAGRAVGLYADFNQFKLPLAPIEDLVAPALELALEFRCSVYDGLYIALAVETGWDFVTADERLYNLLRPGFPQIRLLRDWH